MRPHYFMNYTGPLTFFEIFSGKEYVLMQPIDPQMEKSAVKSVLQAEYALLCSIGNTLKHEFDKHAESGVNTLPTLGMSSSFISLATHNLKFYSEFYFNFKGSILGSPIPSLLSHSHWHYSIHSIFIATLLLPCGELDGKMKKFTRNDEFRDADDHLTKAVYAFAHFTVAVYNQQNTILCDFQGEIWRLSESLMFNTFLGHSIFDYDKVMCLIDPQEHMYVSDS